MLLNTLSDLFDGAAPQWCIEKALETGLISEAEARACWADWDRRVERWVDYELSRPRADYDDYRDLMDPGE